MATVRPPQRKISESAYLADEGEHGKVIAAKMFKFTGDEKDNC